MDPEAGANRTEFSFLALRHQSGRWVRAAKVSRVSAGGTKVCRDFELRWLMHSQLIRAAFVLMGIWLFLLPLRLAIDLRRVSHERVRSRPVEGVSGADDASIDDME